MGNNPVPLFIIACGGVAVFGALAVLVGIRIFREW